MTLHHSHAEMQLARLREGLDPVTASRMVEPVVPVQPRARPQIACVRPAWRHKLQVDEDCIEPGRARLSHVLRCGLGLVLGAAALGFSRR